MFKNFLKKTKSELLGQPRADASDCPPEAVIEAASHMPMLTYDVVYACEVDVKITVARRRERKGESVWLVSRSDEPEVVVGSQVYLVNGQRIPEGSEHDTDLFAWDVHSPWPRRLTLVLPPTKTGTLTKKSRSGRDKWDERVVKVARGVLKYYEVLSPSDMKEKGEMDLHRVKLSYLSTKDRPFCICLSKSSSDMLILSFLNDDDRLEWAATIYTVSEMATRGISTAHATQLGLAKPTAIPPIDQDSLGPAFRKAIPF
ncbi:hypothetical protein SDRG_15261 [Saprolegnia diclina VS20]|uniref:PH domain-containing protein n=1 Tax=Saprolegnia diclina (strain VS20) TaxID=1156394 RepID=T0PNE4_SAPDV|nr:hypothetical protein SDRG_15261 [Saprolegnia diclina VS20]EQC26929.1 hypothetical protein SDRG_15261 [Saprolegnia diclina VS20]|eukprot:XP_008619650.1 hypothetical protein SDRG_15261 [Saprolegnia diclina VS20]